MAKKGLGRSFDSLIPTDLFDDSFDPTAKQDEKISDLRRVPIEKIQPDIDQPRRHFDEVALEELTASIRVHGVLQPIVVMPVKGDLFQIVAGERRYRAATRAELKELPVIIRTLSAQHKLELSLIENIQRRDLNPLETATAYMKLRDQFNLTLEQIGERVGGKSTSTISNTLRLLRLPESVKQALAEGILSEGQVRPLIGVDPSLIDRFLNTMIQEEWSARRVEQYISSLKKQTGSVKKSTVSDYSAFGDRLTKRFSTPVKVTTKANGAGRIEISFKNEAELERIQDLLKS